MDKTFDHKLIEKKFTDKWEEQKTFSFSPGSKPSAQPYTIMLPPPNITGSLHVGHALCYTLQDILIRYKRMKGFDVLWQLGLDHAGIVTQLLVEKELASKGIDRRQLGREKFIDAVWEWKEQSGGTILNQMRCLGASGDFSRVCFTMDEQRQKAVREVFVKLYNDGLIYRDKRLVNWDPKLKSAISDLEILNQEVDGSMWYIKYPLVDDEGCSQKHITIATTRPETMLADVAVAVHPDDARYTMLIGKHLRLPLTDRIIPIIADEYIDREKGSGALKVTPAHDFNDFEIGQRHGLEAINILTPDARINDSVAPQYRGLTQDQARELILAQLVNLGLLEKEEKIKHFVPYADRSGARVEPYLTDQWFLDAPKLAAEALRVVESGEIRFVPKNWENTYFDWMRNIKPWCISRQIWWGHQIPAWYGPDDKIFVANSDDDAHSLAEKHYGRSVELRRDEDVLDTWFSSGLWTFTTLNWPDETYELKRYHPTNVLITGFDIIFFWVARMIMLTTCVCKQIPFKDVYIHAIVRDEKGRKMSKSKGNVLDPLDLIDKFGADALRFTIASLCTPARSVNMGEERIAGYRNFITKLWNATRFLVMNECKYDDRFDISSAKAPINQWIIAKVISTIVDTENAIESYRFDEAAKAIYQSVWGVFCDWYLELTKPIMNGDNQEEIVETKLTAGWAVAQFIKILHPIAPFITEELAEAVAITEKGALLSTSSWPCYSLPKGFDKSTKEVEWVCQAISAIRSIRSDIHVSPSNILQIIVSEADKAKYSVSKYETFIQKLARIDVKYASTDSNLATVSVIVEGCVIKIILDQSIDIQKEKSRLQAELIKLQTDSQSIQARLTNQGFMAKASESVITDHKQQLASLETRANRLQELIASLNAGRC
ncbi:MAG: valine--tRNA ligase [Holosporales bacterium]|jgi:valyl-tRNA synthetase|nr:valine--tRNA ligase [Holosporales bacterium]